MTIHSAKQTDTISSAEMQSSPAGLTGVYSDNFMDGAFCASTLRIVIVSPMPSSLRNLIAALTMKCYDVLLFHHEHDATLPLLQADLFIIDRRFEQVQSASLRRHETPVFQPPATHLLYLVKAAALQTGDRQLAWPGEVEEAMELIERLAVWNQQQAGMLEAADGGYEDGGDERIVIKDLELDLKRLQVKRHNELIALTKTEFDLLQLLMTSGGRVQSRQRIMDQLWGDNYYGGSNSVDVHIKSLRQKLGDDPKKPQYIETVRGVGYRFIDQ